MLCWAKHWSLICGANVTGCFDARTQQQTSAHTRTRTHRFFFSFSFFWRWHSSAAEDWRSLEMLRHWSVWNNHHNMGSGDDLGSAGPLIISITGTSWLHLKAINVPSEWDCVFLQGMFKNSAAPDCWLALANNNCVVFYFSPLWVCSYNTRSQWAHTVFG